MREEAERDRDPPEPKRKKKKKRKARDRVSVEMLPDGGLLKIAPTPVSRDREIWITLVVFAGFFAIIFGGTYRGPNGAILASAITVALIVLLLVTAPTWHVRWTKSGDMVVYKRDPRRPTWVGRCGNLLVETSMTTSKKKFIGWLKFLPTNGAKHFYPITKADTDTMHHAAHAASFQTKRTDWGI